MEYETLDNYQTISNDYNYYIFDCDGVIYKGTEVLESTVKAINYLLDQNKKLFFLSNTNSQSRQDLFNKLIKTGINSEKITYHNVYTSSYLISKHIKLNYPEINHVYLIGLKGMRDELENVGIKVTGGSDDNNKEFEYHHPEKYPIDETIQATVVGYDYNINYYKTFYASQVVFKTGKFFGTNYDHKIIINGIYLPASYTIITPIEVCTERKAEIVTKPDPRSLKVILNDHDINESELSKFIMIGDNIGTDILFGNNAGISSLLVFTGNTTEDEYFKLKEENKLIAKPSFVMKKF